MPAFRDALLAVAAREERVAAVIAHSFVAEHRSDGSRLLLETA